MLTPLVPALANDVVIPETKLLHFPTQFTSDPEGIVQGKDGAIWFTSCLGRAIGRLKSGHVTTYPLPGRFGCAKQIASSPSGDLWFTDDRGPVGGMIGRITLKGEIREYPLSSVDPQPSGIIVARDGTIWFTETDGLGHMDKSGHIDETHLPSKERVLTERPPIGVYALVEASDGSIWFTESYDDKLSVLRNGKITRYDLPQPYGYPRSIIKGLHNDLWFTNEDATGHVMLDGTITEYPFASQTPIIGQAEGLAIDSNGTCWVAQYDWSATVFPTGTITEHSLTDDHRHPPGATAVLVDRDANVWFTEDASIAKLSAKAAADLVGRKQ